MVGDNVFAPDGSVQQVKVSHQYIPAKCYTIHLDDGVTVTGDQHLSMMLQTKKWRDRWSQHVLLKTTTHRKKFTRALVRRSVKEMHEGTLLHRDGRQEYSIGNCRPVMYPWVDLPVPAYVMGVWYGTMYKNGKHFATSRPVEKIQKRFRGLGFYASVKKQKSGLSRFYFRPSIKESFLFADALPPTGMPTQYLHSSVEQREDLLEGLVDGRLFKQNQKSNKHVARFVVYKEARLFQELLEGLGYRTVLSFSNADRCYVLSFLYDRANLRFTRRFLTKITTSEPVQCCHLLAEQPILVGEGFLAVC
jgi:hypothetical protein